MAKIADRIRVYSDRLKKVNARDGLNLRSAVALTTEEMAELLQEDYMIPPPPGSCLQFCGIFVFEMDAAAQKRLADRLY